MYKNVIFDLYGTLVDIHTNENKRNLWRKLAYFYGFHGAKYTSTELRREYLQLCLNEEEKLSKVNYPEINLQKVFLQLFLKKGIEAKEELGIQAGELFRILSLEYLQLYDGVIELLEELQNRKKRIYLLTNAQRIFTEPEIRYLNLDSYFDGIVISSDEGCKKPSADFFEILLDRYQLEKNETIMIGNDSISDIQGACDIGLSSFYIHSNLSPDVKEDIRSTYCIMDGDRAKFNHLLLKIIEKPYVKIDK